MGIVHLSSLLTYLPVYVLMYVDICMGTHRSKKWVSDHWDSELQPFVGAQVAVFGAMLCTLVVMVV